ncbi:MAG: cytotoxic translational repressor of toxin-antitoxin stability system [Opitutaceae bacterium]|nr:cytotoxic translational repressor of toxin-antitoxin stability system [Opitutaceae bacterium]
MGELNKLGTLAQMDVIEPLSNLTAAALKKPREPLGSFRRGSKTLFRLRSGPFRIYFEKTSDDTLRVDYLLHTNSLEDFLLRNKLPVSEAQLVKQDSKILRYLESLAKKTPPKPPKK